MKILLDECVTAELKPELVGHEVATVAEMGWLNAKNGELLQLAETQFDVLLTVDKHLQHQQNLKKFNLAVLVMVARNNRIEWLLPLVPKVLAALRSIRRGAATRVH